MAMKDPNAGGAPANAQVPPEQQQQAGTPPPVQPGQQQHQPNTETEVTGRMDPMTDDEIAQLPPRVQKQIRSLRYENGTIRNKYNATSEQLAQIERDRKAAEEAELVRQNNYKTLSENQAKEHEAEANRLKKVAIDSSLEAAAILAGIPKKLHKLIEKSGILIKPDGTIEGVEQAIQQCKDENADVLAPFLKPQNQHVQGQPNQGVQVPTGQVDPNNAATYMVQPGTNLTYAQIAAMNAGNVGKDPPQAGTPQSKPFDATKLGHTPEDQAKVNEQYQKIIRGGK